MFEESFDYLAERGVSLVIGHPKLTPHYQSPRRPYRISDLQLFRIYDGPGRVPSQALQVVEFPVNAMLAIRTLYLTPHPDVDSAIQRFGLSTYPVESSFETMAKSRQP